MTSLPFRVAAERHVLGEIAIADDDAGRVHAGIARKSFEYESRSPTAACVAGSVSIARFSSGVFSARPRA